MKKINNKGFALVEVLVATVFVSVVFTFIYINTLPTLGDYEKQELYDPIETKYVGHLIAELLMDPKVTSMEEKENIKNTVTDKYVIQLKLGTIGANDNTKFSDLSSATGIQNIYITRFNLENIPVISDPTHEINQKDKIIQRFSENDAKESSEFKDYIESLPTFNVKYHSNEEEINGKTITYNYRIFFSIKDALDQEHFGNYKLSL